MFLGILWFHLLMPEHNQLWKDLNRVPDHFRNNFEVRRFRHNPQIHKFHNISTAIVGAWFLNLSNLTTYRLIYPLAIVNYLTYFWTFDFCSRKRYGLRYRLSLQIWTMRLLFLLHLRKYKFRNKNAPPTSKTKQLQTVKNCVKWRVESDKRSDTKTKRNMFLPNTA